jgi:DNA-binding FadR family transcriptional regulator
MADHKAVSLNTRIRAPKNSEIFADQIRAQIVRGELKEGGFLPPEHVLMETLGISRPTLREAYRILEAEGLISVVRGSHTGAKVHKPSVDLVSRYAGYVLESQGMTVADLYQARLAIEPTVVRWLATDPVASRTEDLHGLLRDLAVMLDEDRSIEFIASVETFHQLLVQACGFKSLIFLSRILLNLASSHERDYQRRYPLVIEERRKTLRAGLRSYEKVVALIDAGKVEEAVAHWRLHLNNASSIWTGHGEGERIVDSLGNALVR